MTPLRCPVCRAGDNLGPQCRRCKADLTLLVRLEEQRERHLQAASLHAGRGDAEGCLYHAGRAHGLRSGADSARWLALAALLQRDFAAAWRLYRQCARLV